ncbi:MAG: biotin carboxylase [Actinomycetes bacterium]
MSASVEGDRRRLRNISEIRTFFRTNETPVFFVGPTAFNLLGLDRWVRNFSYITYYDSWEGAHPRVFCPTDKPYVEFQSAEEINNYLLRHPEVQQFIARRGGTPKVALVFFDDETEAICDELGYELILPPHSLRQHLDSKITTTRLGNEAGAPSVPNVLGTADSYAELVDLSSSHDLGTDLVIQLPYGDSGKTTFFVKSEGDWDAHSGDIVGQELKVMKRINNKAAAVEAVLTRHGTIVGPFMTDFTGYLELTPYQGGWCGNDLFPDALSDEHRARGIELVRRLGDRLAKEGYKGFFEVDVLVDLDTDEVYLGELNPRISGASSITNVTAGAYADIPLFLFHLLEYLDVDYQVDVDEINERWRELAAVDVWSQLVMKDPEDRVERIEAAPRTGQWQMHEDGTLTFHRAALDWHQLQDETECFFLRVYGPGDFRFKGADLGILVTKGRLQTDEPKALTDRAQRFIHGIHDQYVGAPVGADVHPPAVSYLTSSAF